MIDTKRTIWYFGLEPLMERYTYQLSEQWIPESYRDTDVNFISLNGGDSSGQITVGSVLDACGRGVYAMTQCQLMLASISKGEVKSGDILLLQDFWTPGIESVFYALDLYGIKVKTYSMLHAQSVDEYDFTYEMRHWMRPFELGIDARHDGIFVGSSIHRDQLRAAGFKSPIHVVSLPIHKRLALEDVGDEKRKRKKNRVVFTSRFDKEKNPYFMLEVAKRFLNRNPNFDWVVTTSASDFRSSVPDFVTDMKGLADEQSRFILKPGLSKAEYYGVLSGAKIQFNSSLQDYVSWTLIESTMFDCDVCYPDFRSFPEILNKSRLYKPFSVESALEVLEECIVRPETHQRISTISDAGRRLQARIILNDEKREFNIWHEFEYFKALESKLF